MENKESFVVIPQYLFDELIEYFDNKSDADNDTPNKEMKLLSQLQEEQTNIKTQMENKKTLPKEIEDYVEKQGLNFPLDMYYISMIKSMIKEAALFGYSLRESKGCEWVNCADKPIGDSSYMRCTRNNGEKKPFNYRDIIEETEDKLYMVDGGYYLKSEVEWLDQSSNSTDELRKEVERLKDLIEDAYIEGVNFEKTKRTSWQQFKETHNL